MVSGSSSPVTDLGSELGGTHWKSTIPLLDQVIMCIISTIALINESQEVARELVRMLSEVERVDAAMDILECLVKDEPSLSVENSIKLVISAGKNAKVLLSYFGLIYLIYFGGKRNWIVQQS